MSLLRSDACQWSGTRPFSIRLLWLYRAIILTDTKRRSITQGTYKRDRAIEREDPLLIGEVLAVPEMESLEI